MAQVQVGLDGRGGHGSPLPAATTTDAAAGPGGGGGAYGTGGPWRRRRGPRRRFPCDRRPHHWRRGFDLGIGLGASATAMCQRPSAKRATFIACDSLTVSVTLILILATHSESHFPHRLTQCCPTAQAPRFHDPLHAPAHLGADDAGCHSNIARRRTWTPASAACCFENSCV